nr:hypothetical protein [Tanacetum cinerariifolium]
MKSIQTFLEKFNCIPFGEKKKILLQAWENFFAIQHTQPEDSEELFQKLLEDLHIINKELAECNYPTFFNDNEEHSVQYKEYLDNSSNEITASNPNQEKEKPPQDSDIRQLVREECRIEVCRKQKKNMEDTMLELVEVSRQKEFYCMHDNVDDLFEKLYFFEKYVSNFSGSCNRTILPTEEPEYSLSMRYDHLSTITKTESDEVTESSVKNLLPIPSEYEVTSEDKNECDVPVCENSPTFDDHSEILSDSNDDDILSDDGAFEDIEYVEASPLDSKLVSLEEENYVHQQEEEFDLKDIFQIQDIVLREKLLSINRLIANIESLNDNPTPDRVLKSSSSFPIFEESDNSLSDNSSPEFKTFSDHMEETRSGNTTTHANNSLPEYDSFCFEIESDQEKLTRIVMNDISDDLTIDPLLEEVDLFLASDNLITQGIRNIDYDSEGDIYFLEELLIDDSIPIPKNESLNFDHQDDPSFPRPPLEPPDAEFDFELDSGELISAVMNNIIELNED